MLAVWLQVPVVIRGPGGVGRQLGAEHSQRLESYFQSIPGVQLVACSTVANSKALLKSAIRSDNPIIFFEHVLLYNVKGASGHFLPLNLSSSPLPHPLPIPLPLSLSPSPLFPAYLPFPLPSCSPFALTRLQWLYPQRSSITASLRTVFRVCCKEGQGNCTWGLFVLLNGYILDKADMSSYPSCHRTRVQQASVNSCHALL